MLAQVLNPASWQTGLASSIAAAASPFASSYAQQQQQQTSMAQLQQAYRAGDGAALIPLSQKLRCLSAALTARFPRGTLAFAQVWVSCTGRVWSGNDKSKLDTVVMRTDAHAACVTDAAFNAFAARSLERGITGSAIGMLGKVWSSGALAVVQNVAIIPSSVHPRDKLEGGLTERMAELVYIPIYDQAQPDAGVLACLEVAVSAVATEALVANVISEAADLLAQLQLALSKQAPVSSASAVSPTNTPRASPPQAQPQTPRPQLPPVRMVPPAPQAMVGPTAAAPPSMPGSPVTASSCSSGSSNGSSPRAYGFSRAQSMARTQSVRCFYGLHVDAMQR